MHEKTVKVSEIVNDNHLKEKLTIDGSLKEAIVNYVGTKLDPDYQGVSVEMIVEVFADEFPELVQALAEENYFRGYTQGLSDAREVSIEPSK